MFIVVFLTRVLLNKYKYMLRLLYADLFIYTLHPRIIFSFYVNTFLLTFRTCIFLLFVGSVYSTTVTIIVLIVNFSSTLVVPNEVFVCFLFFPAISVTNYWTLTTVCLYSSFVVLPTTSNLAHYAPVAGSVTFKAEVQTPFNLNSTTL